MTFDPSDPSQSSVPSEPSGFRGGPALPAMPVEEPRRAASLTLRSDDVRESRAASMEAANRSLADALKITYRLLQLVMVGLVALFVLSGFQQVNQSETGIRVELGRIKADNLEPGFQFSLPYPLGEIVKIQRGSQTLELDESFWPSMRPEDRRKSLDEMGVGSPYVEPGKDGSLLTGDNNIAHAQLSIVFSRVKPADFIKNIYAPHEQALVRAAVERAAVSVAASITIDDLLKPGGTAGAGAENSIESRIRQIAQRTLDEAGSGLEIAQVLIRTATPPLNLRKDFGQVQIAQSNAGKEREQALGERSQILNGVAGSAHTAILDLIDDYEKAIELNDEPAAQLVLDSINLVLDGERNGQGIELAGRSYPELQLSGFVAQMISDAQQYRSTIVQQSQRESETFGAKLAQYHANPSLFLSGALVEAMQTFYNSPLVEPIWSPPTTDPLELALTRDPQVSRDAERAQKEKELKENARVKRMQEFLQNR